MNVFFLRNKVFTMSCSCPRFLPTGFAWDSSHNITSNLSCLSCLSSRNSQFSFCSLLKLGTNFHPFFYPTFFFCNSFAILLIWNGFYTWSKFKNITFNSSYNWFKIDILRLLRLPTTIGKPIHHLKLLYLCWASVKYKANQLTNPKVNWILSY